MKNRIITYISFLVFLWPHSPLWGGSFSLRPEGTVYQKLTKEEQGKIDEFLKEAESLIPPSMKSVINGPVIVKWKKLDKYSKPVAQPCSDAEAMELTTPPIYGQLHYPFTLKDRFSRPPHIRVNANFIATLLNRDGDRSGEKEKKEDYACGHKNFYRLALASVLHELTHHYHQLQRHSGSESFKNEEHQFKHLTGWIKNGLFRIKRYQGNTLHHRSPDPYEYTDPAEALAVNMEYFLLDPEYVCRRPAIGKFFIKHFNFDPYPHRPCQIPLGLHLDTEMGPTLDKLTVDPKRVYAIHYLHADTGKSFVSKWGHAMLRIILCAPEREAVGPECLQDVQHHLVVSFRAQTNRSALSPFYGLTGRYPNKGFIFPFLKIHEEYTLYSGRNLISLPLQLDQDAKEFLIYHLLEEQNEYLSKYYFLSNNCATEADNLLKASVPDKELQKILPRTPLGLMKNLIQLGLATDLETINAGDPSRALREGYYFTSNKEQLRNSFKEILQIGNEVGIGKKLKSMTVEGLLEKYTPEERRKIFEDIHEKIKDTTQSKKLAGHFFLLESFIHQKSEYALKKRMGQLVLKMLQKEPRKSCSNGDLQKIKDILEQTKEIQDQFNLTSQTKAKGYGIPLPQDIDERPVHACSLTPEEAGEKLLTLYQETIQIIRKMNPKEAKIMDESQQNYEYYFQQAMATVSPSSPLPP